MIKDPKMFMRTTIYDMLTYDRLWTDKKESIDLVVTIVIYYGETAWTDSKGISKQMKKYDEELKKYEYQGKYEFVDVKNFDYTVFHDKEVRDLFDGIQRCYQFNKKQRQEIFKDMELTRDTAIVLCATVGIKELKKYINKEGLTNMCEAIRRVMEEDRIEMLTSQLKRKLGVLSSDIQELIRLSPMEKINDLTLSIFDISNEDDIVQILNC